MSDAAFWLALDHLAAAHVIVIDRPRGRPHPRRPELIYPFDYGYLEGTTSGDGQGIDVWRGSLLEAVVTGAVVTADVGKRDVELKLLLGCTPDEAQHVRRFLADEAGLPCILLVRPLR